MGEGLLGVGDSGDAVAQLHENLGRRGVEVSAEEVRRKFFGPSTRQAVRVWQAENSLDPSGVVDERTIRTFSSVIESVAPVARPAGGGGVDSIVSLAAGALVSRSPTAQASETNGGPVLAAQHAEQLIGPALWINSRGDEVRRLHEALGVLGVSIPGGEETESVFGVGTEAAVRVVQTLGGLEPTGVFDMDVQQALVKTLAAAAYGTPRVEGRLRTDVGGPAADALLRLYRHGADGEVDAVGEGRTDSDGYFRLDYDAAPDPAAAVEVRLVGAEGDEIPISHPKPAVARHEVLNLLAPTTAVPAATELERLAADVERALGGFEPLVRAVTEPAEGDQPNGTDPLAATHRSTGWDARVLALAGAAAGLAATADLDLRGTYALVRHGLPIDPDELAAVHPDTVRVALARAVDAGLVRMDQGQIESFTAQFAAFAGRARLASRPSGALSTYGEFLDSTGLDKDRRVAFERAVAGHADDPVKLWSAARAAGIDEPMITRLRTQGKLAVLTMQNLPLTTDIMQEVLGGAERPDLRSLVVAADLHTPAAWRARLTKLAGGDDERLRAVVPPGFFDKGIEGKDAADRYAGELARQVRLAFPTAVLASLVRAREIDLGAEHVHLAGPVAELIGRAEELGFSFSSTPLGPFLLDHGSTLTAGLDEPTAAAAVGQFQRLQRLYQISPSNEALAALAKEGVGSALDIAALDKREFLRRFGKQFVRPDELELVHRRARQVAAVAYSFFGISKDVGAIGTWVTSLPDGQRAQVVESLIKKFPTVEELFGEQDFCVCPHCRSVLSPAAYFVDLLHFLDPDGATSAKPFDTLSKRRPDLEYLPLTCENTNTVLPMLDVANEIMEYQVVHGDLDKDAVRDTGPAVTADLLAEPQYLLPDAYSTLRDDTLYPMNLPFDLWHETVHGFLSRGEVDLGALLDAFRRTDEIFPEEPPPSEGKLWYRRSAVFFEQLGFSHAEAAVFTSPDIEGWFRLYGYDNVEDARTQLRSAKVLARRLGVSYVELVELVKTWFVNPNLDAVATLRSAGLEVLDVMRFCGAAGVAPLSDLETAAVTAKLDAATTAFGRDDFNAASWLDDAWADGRFDNVLLLADDDPGCSFDKTVLRFAGPRVPNDSPRLDSSLDAVLLRLNLLVRIVRRLGRPLGELDLALSALLPGGAQGLAPAKLPEALRTALVYLAHLEQIAARLGSAGPGRLDLVTLWGPMPTRGPESTYARLFLSPRTGRPDPVFDHPAGAYLSGGAMLIEQQAAVQAALSMSADEVSAVCAASGLTLETAPLTLGTVSLLYRYALLARATNLPIAELIVLRELAQAVTPAGVDPLRAPLYTGPRIVSPTPEQTLPLPTGAKGEAADFPLSGTLAFLDILDDLRAAGLSVAEVDYLMRHHFDPIGPIGPFRPDEAAVQRLAIQVSDGVRNLEERYAPPQRRHPAQDPATLTDEEVSRVLGLVLPTNTATRVAALWQRQVAYTAKQSVDEKDQIAPGTLAAFPELTVEYDANLQIQRLTYRGYPVPGRVAAIRAANSSSVLAELLESVADDASRERQATYGWLICDDDVSPLFEPPPDLSGLDPAAAGRARQDYERARRTRFAERVMPRVLDAARRRFVVDTVRNSVRAQSVELPSEFVEALLTDTDLLRDPRSGQPLAEVLAGVTARGLSATARDPRGDPVNLPTGDRVADATTAGLHGVAEVNLDGYLQVPTSGQYRFRLTVGALGDTGQVWIGDGPDPVLSLTAAGNDEHRDVVVDLGADGLHRVTLRACGAASASARDLLKGPVACTVAAETLALGPLSRLSLRPAAAVEEFRDSYLLYRKADMLVGRLGLSERECRHFTRYAVGFGDFSLSDLPTIPLAAGVPARQFDPLRRLIVYIRLRTDMAGGTEDLIDVFELSRRPSPAGASVLGSVCERVASIARRDPDTVATVAGHLGLRAAADDEGRGLADERGLRRLWDALVLVKRLGISADSAIVAATPSPDAAVAQRLRDAVRARYDLDAWRSLAKAVNDPLRQRRRDALVAYLLHRLGLERVEQLCEYLLLDPATEPVVQTTRMRLAISSVQLFIQRCLLSLEERVPAVAIDSGRWAWMKRYRVWEANRKVFLFPENWLDPELRDDQTHLFTALLGTLMQGDLTNDRAEDALLAYLRGLAEIARLEIVSVWAEPDRHDPALSTLHVLGRDHNSPRDYYYRRFEHRLWTPWEPVGAQIEGDDVMAVVYRGRLHIFWVTLLEKAADAGMGATSVSGAAGKNVDDFKRYDVQAQLHWTELVSGQWTPRASGDMLTIAEGLNSLQPDRLPAYVVKDVDAAGREQAVTIRLQYLLVADQQLLEPTLRFVSGHGRPSVTVEQLVRAPSVVAGWWGSGPDPRSRLGRLELDGDLQRILNLNYSFIFNEFRPFSTVEAPDPSSRAASAAARVVSPYFYADRYGTAWHDPDGVKTFTGQNTFFVRPSLSSTLWADYQGSIMPAVTASGHTADSVEALEIEAVAPVPIRALATGQVVITPRERVDKTAVFTMRTPADWVTVTDAPITVGRRLMNATATPAREAHRVGPGPETGSFTPRTQ